jgi:acid phosphatase (class A)
MKFKQALLTRLLSGGSALWLFGIGFPEAVATSLNAAETTALAPAQVHQVYYATPDQTDVAALLPPPPLPDSPEQAADMETVRAVYRTACTNDIAAAYAEKKFSVFNFAPDVGTYFQSDKLPRTTAFFKKIQADAATVADDGKDLFRRPRPYTVDTNLANGKLEKSFSYPSGHSTESMVLALVLADVLPDRRDAILARARSIGWHRVQIARHYPTDIYAGRVLAQAIVRQMQKSEAFKKELAEVKDEIAAARN